MRELTFLIAAANKETDLRKRMERLQHAGDLLESLSRIMPELDSGFWFSSLQRELIDLQMSITRGERIPIDDVNEAVGQVFGANTRHRQSKLAR